MTISGIISVEFFSSRDSSLRTSIYVDGILEDSTERVGPHDGTTTQVAELWIGLRSPGKTMPFDGLIDEIRIYGRELHEKEILRLFQLKGSALKATP